MLEAMPWKENRALDLRVQLMQDYRDGHSISALAEIYEVSRKTIYKWLGRHEEGGVAGLADRRRTPQHSPSKLSGEIIAQIVAARQRWKWGPRKLRVKLAAAHPEIDWPAQSTMGEVFKPAGLTHPLVTPTSRKFSTKPPEHSRKPKRAMPAPMLPLAALIIILSFMKWHRA